LRLNRSIKISLTASVLAVALSIALPTGSAFARTPDWVRRLPLLCGCPLAVSTGPDNVYVGGLVERSLGAQPFAGGTDAFVRSYDLEGRLLWTREFGTSQNDAVTGSVADASGVYVVGYLNALTLNNHDPSVDAFVKKFSPSGALLWTQMIATPKQDEAFGVALDASGGLYVTGTTHGTLAGETSAGRADVFVEHFLPDGTELWAHQLGTAKGDFAEVITIGPGGAIYLAGTTYGVFPGIARKGGFLARLDPTGMTVRWVRGRIGAGEAEGIAVEGKSVYVSFSGYISFSGNILRRYASDGTLEWGRSLPNLRFAQGLIARHGGVILGGSTPTPFSGRTGLGGSDLFLRSYGADGSVRWTDEFGTSSDDYGLTVAGSMGATYLAGVSTGTWPTDDVAGHGEGFLTHT
jgi:hypothetical protein